MCMYRERGDPKELLRSINPREAQLADAAAGVHVRFRLGGTTFPPLVFYKIFTHRPITGGYALSQRGRLEPSPAVWLVRVTLQCRGLLDAMRAFYWGRRHIAEQVCLLMLFGAPMSMWYSNDVLDM